MLSVLKAFFCRKINERFSCDIHQILHMSFFYDNLNTNICQNILIKIVIKTYVSGQDNLLFKRNLSEANSLNYKNLENYIILLYLLSNQGIEIKEKC